MSEAASHEHRLHLVDASHYEGGGSAEIIDLQQSTVERVTGEFLDELSATAEQGQGGLELALHIKARLTATPGEDPDPAKERLLDILSSADFSEEWYDHKDEHDPVFQRLVGALKTTKDRQRSLHEQRQATLKLTELRSTLRSDETDHDDQWYGIIDRLFS